MITGFHKVSTIDYPGKISSVAFFKRCDYQCPSCHAKQIISGKNEIPEEEIFNYLDSRKGLIDSVVLCGGEPTLCLGLGNFARKIKERGLAVKLDTNGSNPAVLADLLKEGLIDYIAMDIKGPESLYSKLTGELIDFREQVKKSAGIMQKAPNYEFRTTLVPVLEEGKFRWMTNEEIREMAKWIDKHIFLNPQNVKWFLQRFVARGKEEMVDERFGVENIPKEYRETPIKVMEESKTEMVKYFPRCEIRN
jgi:pyruvate formate lyase activating enzyme